MLEWHNLPVQAFIAGEHSLPTALSTFITGTYVHLSIAEAHFLGI